MQVRRTLTTLMLLVSSLSILLIGGTSAQAHAQDAAAPIGRVGKVLTVGVNGLRWDDLGPTTPNLQQLARTSDMGVLSTRSIRRQSCPIDAWLSLGAGMRAADTPRDPGGPLCKALPAEGLSPERWEEVVRYNTLERYQPQLGLLGETLHDEKKTLTSIGPGARLALTSTDGQDALTHHDLDETDLQDHVRTSLQGSDLVMVDLGNITVKGALAPADQTGAPTRLEQAQRLDMLLGKVLQGARESRQDAHLIVASASDSGWTPRLQLVMETTLDQGTAGETQTAGLLTSSSTRHQGLSQSVDLTPSILHHLGVRAAPGMVGSPIHPQGHLSYPERLQEVKDLDQASNKVAPLVPQFFQGMVITQVVLYALAGVVLLRRRQGVGRTRTLRLLHYVAITCGSIPAGTYLANLVPWWRSDTPLPHLSMLVILFAVLVALLALSGPWRRNPLGPLAVVGGVTSLVLTLDMLTGTNLATSSLMGLQPVVGGRFYGLGNVQYALFGAGMLLVTGSITQYLHDQGRRRLKLLTILLLGGLTIVVDGTPGLGSDLGGPPSLIVAFFVLLMLSMSYKITWRRAILVAGGGGTLIGLVMLLDSLRDDPTHLGRFFQSITDGQALPIIVRKGQQNLDILLSSELTLLVPLAGAFIALVLLRPGRLGSGALQGLYQESPMLRHTTVALLWMVGVGFFVNDSGVAIPAVASVMVVPLLVGACAEHMRRRGDQETGTPGRPGGVLSEQAKPRG